MPENLKDQFPEGSMFSGDYAFVPQPGGGFETVIISELKKDKSLNDNLSKKQDTDKDAPLDDIEFAVDLSLGRPEQTDAVIKPQAEPEPVKEAPKPAPKKKKVDQKKIYENIHKGHRMRLRKRYDETGLLSFSEHEVLEFLLYFIHEQRDTNPIAHALIDEFGGLHQVFKAEMHDLQTIPGVGPESALLINFCRQLITYLNANIKDKPCLNDTTKMGMFCCNYFMQHVEESFIAIMLDTKRCVQKVVVISRGTENETAYYPRNVLKAVIKHRANTVAIAHNHTGGSVHPSNSDIHLSNKIGKLLDGIGVPLIDHIICCDALFTSLSERGLMNT